MKLVHYFALAATLVLGLGAQNVFADVLISCSWVNTSQTSIYNGVRITQSCKDGSIVAATRQRTWGQYYNGECSSLTAKTGYRVSGSCLSPSVYRKIPVVVVDPGVTSCAHPNALYATNVPGSQMSSTITTALAGYCSDCGISVRPGSYSDSYYVFCGNG
ncbi:hypothetical protein [Teredinibacter purpureus]|uniref:hypothetical protein n=1 Tax=Teredinibacter purpureus TaxID=2731756 RepID=UPI0005F803BF|nr:hypothetical protein [Teredinibacter purpureus]